MRYVVCLLIYFISVSSFSQGDEEKKEEFIPILIEKKEAFISTKTGEYVFKSHEETDPNNLRTTPSGVIYTDIFYHSVKKKESLFGIAKNYGLSVEELIKLNELPNTDLNVGQKLKIKKTSIVKSSSPVISYDGEERIIAKLRPHENPWELNAPPPVSAPSRKLVEGTDAIHVVKYGETLFSIAKKNNISVEELKSLNNLNLNNIAIGQKLKVK